MRLTAASGMDKISLLITGEVRVKDVCGMGREEDAGSETLPFLVTWHWILKPRMTAESEIPGEVKLTKQLSCSKPYSSDSPWEKAGL